MFQRLRKKELQFSRFNKLTPKSIDKSISVNQETISLGHLNVLNRLGYCQARTSETKYLFKMSEAFLFDPPSYDISDTNQCSSNPFPEKQYKLTKNKRNHQFDKNFDKRKSRKFRPKIFINKTIFNVHQAKQKQKTGEEEDCLKNCEANIIRKCSGVLSTQQPP